MSWRRSNSWILKSYSYTTWLWVLLALTSLGFQASRTSTSSTAHINLMSTLSLIYVRHPYDQLIHLISRQIGEVELYITVAFDIEIIWRIVGEFPDWRQFFVHRHNLLDLTLVIGSTIIQIPAINSSNVYPWLTSFQLARFYRVIFMVPRMQPLLVSSSAS